MNNPNILMCKTVGHSIYDLNSFIYILKEQLVDCIIDVRSTPYSGHNPQFNRENLKNQLETNGIRYIFMGKALGARYNNPEVLYLDGKVDFKKVRELKEFQAGIDAVINLLKEGKHPALMCAEKDPMNCHRFVLVSYALSKRGIHVIHILSAENSIEQEKLEELLLEKYKKNEFKEIAEKSNNKPSQRLDTYFPKNSNPDRSRIKKELLLEEVYELRNKDIAFISKTGDLSEK